MNVSSLLAALLLPLLAAGCAARPAALALRQPTLVEAACGECQFGLKGKDCELAIRIRGQEYFVDGVDERVLGDAHAPEGICMAIRQARVTGTIRHGRFAATGFELLPARQP